MSESSIANQVEIVMRELIERGSITAGKIVVIGTSTSEVVGAHIGTAGAEEIASQLYEGIERVRREHGFHVAYQCCEHLNRALVVEREWLDISREPLEEVHAVPVRTAGGSMAAHAYRQLQQPCLVETLSAHAGIDIGDTLIGMHLRRVAVPLRTSIRRIGEAHVNAAYTRPKYTGGPRAVYERDSQAASSASEGTCT
jgi:uncharacterized protein (TIGR01440 family)